MAQLVKLEPGDILVLSNIGGDAFADEGALQTFSDLMKEAGVEHVFVFPDGVDLSKVSADALARP